MDKQNAKSTLKKNTKTDPKKKKQNKASEPTANTNKKLDKKEISHNESSTDFVEGVVQVEPHKQVSPRSFAESSNIASKTGTQKSTLNQKKEHQLEDTEKKNSDADRETKPVDTDADRKTNSSDTKSESISLRKEGMKKPETDPFKAQEQGNAAKNTAATHSSEQLVHSSEEAEALHSSDKQVHEDAKEDIKIEDEDDEGMSLRDHFRDLRKRLLNCLLIAFAGFLICYPFGEEIFSFLVKPLDAALPPGSRFQYTAAHEAFFIFMKVSFISGIFLMSPLIFYQIWAFIAPGLYKKEKVFIVPTALFSALFFVGGAVFCYYIFFPVAFNFFMQYSNDRIIAMPTLRESFGFVLQLIVAFGIVFEMPLFIFFLARIGIVTADWLKRTRRYAILAIVIVAAILTPPDVISQLMMAVPMLVLYEVGIIVAQIFGKKKAVALTTEEPEANE